MVAIRGNQRPYVLLLQVVWVVLDVRGPGGAGASGVLMLALPGATLAGVRSEPEGMVVELRLRARRLRCRRGWSTRSRYDCSRRRWRHLDAGGCRLWLEAEIRRLDCRRCGKVVTEEVPSARPRAWHSRDFEDVVAWLAQRTDKTTIATLLRCSWKAVDNIIRLVVAEALDAAGSRAGIGSGWTRSPTGGATTT
jgi:transposase